MKRRSLLRPAVLATLLLLPAAATHAFDMRTWLTADGQLIEAAFVRSLGDAVEVNTKEGRSLRFIRPALSLGDQDYLQANAPQEKKPAVGAAAAAGKIPQPAKAAKMDRTQFKLAGEMKVAARSYKVVETPHFKILHLPPAEPLDLAELAERLWLDAAFFYGGFLEKWQGRKMAIIVVNDDAALKEAMLWNGADGKGAAVDRAGPEGTAGVLQIPEAEATAAGIFSYLRILRGCGAPPGSNKPQPLKGVWRPCNVHMLVLDLLRILIGSGSIADGGFGNQEGSFALTAGTAYYKEILLTGRAETRVVVGARGTEAHGGFPAGKPWAAELKTMMKKGGAWTPSFNEVTSRRETMADTNDIVFAWSFARFLQNTPDRLMAFNQLCRKTAADDQVPDLEELARIYGFASGPEMEKAWVTWMNSGDFR